MTTALNQTNQTTTTALDIVDRRYLREYLEQRFALDDLKTLAFNLGVNYELFSHETAPALSRELILHVERQDQLGSLLQEALRLRYDDSVCKMQSKIPLGSRYLMIVIDLSDHQPPTPSVNIREVKTQLANVFQVPLDKVLFSGVAAGSVRLLVSVPASAAKPEALSRVGTVATMSHYVSAVRLFETLDDVSQRAWRFVVCEKPPILEGDMLQPTVTWQQALGHISQRAQASSKDMSLGTPSMRVRGDKVGLWLGWFTLLSALWWVFSFFFLSRYLNLPWILRDCLASGFLVILSLTAPHRIRGLAITSTSWWFITYLIHDFIVSAIWFIPGAILDNTLLFWLLSWLLAAITGAVAILALVAPSLWFASEFLLAFQGGFGLTRRDTFRALLTVGFGLQYPYLIVENGQATVSKPKGLLNKIGGPGLVIIRPGNTVVFERLGRVTQIAGPGITTTRLFEFHKQIVQLRPRWISFSGETVLTQDGIPLKLQGGLGARIEPASVTNDLIAAAGGPGSYTWASGFRDQIRGEFPVYRDSAFRAVYLPSGPNWEITLGGTTVAMIRDAVGRRRLQDIFGEPDTGIPPNTARVIQEIEQEAVAALRAFVHSWGILVTGVEIALLEPPEEIQKRVLKRWTIAGDNQMIESLGNAQAQAEQTVQTIKMAAFQGMMGVLQDTVTTAGAVLPPQQMVLFQGIIQTIAANTTQDSASALRYIEALEKLRGQPGGIVVGPPGPIVNVEQHD